jgi:hypothetical protein
MADKSTYFRDAVLNVMRNTGISAITTTYVSLHTADPGLTGASEVTAGGNSYARQDATFGAPGDGGGGRQIANTAAITWTDMPSVTVTHVGLWDASTVGNFLYGDALTASQVVNAGGTFEFPIGNLTVTEL